MNSQSVTPWWLDKGLYVFVLNFLLPPLSARLGWQISPDKVAALAVISVAFIVAHKVKSFKILALELEYAALAKVKAAVGADPAVTTAPPTSAAPVSA